MSQPICLQNLKYWSEINQCFQSGDLSISNGKITESPDKRALDYNKEGYWAVPGFTDCHVHLVSYALSASRLQLDGMDLESIQNQVKYTVNTMGKGDWVRGRGWEASCRLQGGFPVRQELDDVSPDNPVALFSKDGHSIWLNSKAIQNLGITEDVKDPPGGRYDRDDHGRLVGVMRETAADQIRFMLPAVTDAEKKKMLRKAVTRLHGQGIIAVHSFGGLDEFRLLLDMDQSEGFPLKVTCHLDYPDFEQGLRENLQKGQGRGWIRLAGLKLYADGALGSRTGAVMQPYTGEPDNTGMDVMSGKDLMLESVRAAQQGFHVAIHAIGDRAVRNSLHALIEARKHAPHVTGMRVEHVQLVDKNDLNLFSIHGICASVQPCHMISDIDMVERFWSQQKGLLYPYGDLDRSGALVVFGSDAPIDNENPILNLRNAVTRTRLNGKWSDRSWHGEQCMNSVSALKAITSRPVLLEAGSARGVITPGLPADIVLFKQNPLTIDPEKLHTLEIAEVYYQGNRVK